MKRTHDCPPTLTDSQVLEFCKNGFLMLGPVVPEDVNRRVIDYFSSEENRKRSEPSELLEQAWFMDNVVLNPRVAGAVRSLLGRDFGLPLQFENITATGPNTRPAGWHPDGGSTYGPAVRHIQVFYYPQDTTREMGPTALVPGSHFLFTSDVYSGHYGGIRNVFYTEAPAGSVFITAFSILHRRAPATSNQTRYAFKHVCYRTSPPQRDWVFEPEFDVATANFYEWPRSNFPAFRRAFRDAYDAAEMYYWLCGRSKEFQLMGGYAWPLNRAISNLLGRAYGIPGEPLRIEG